MNNPLKKIKLDNKKALLVILIAPVLVYLDYTFVLKLQLQGLRNTGPRIQKLKGDLSALSAQFAMMQEVKNKHLQAKEEALSKAKKFISEEEIPSLLEEVAKTAQENGVELIQMKPLRERPAAAGAKDAIAVKFSPLLINLSLSCGYHELGRFLSGLENKEEFIGVEGLVVSAQQKDYFKHKVELTLRAYVEKKD